MNKESKLCIVLSFGIFLFYSTVFIIGQIEKSAIIYTPQITKDMGVYDNNVYDNTVITEYDEYDLEDFEEYEVNEGYDP